MHSYGCEKLEIDNYTHHLGETATFLEKQVHAVAMSFGVMHFMVCLLLAYGFGMAACLRLMDADIVNFGT